MNKFTQPTKNIWFDQKEPLYDPSDPKLNKQFKDYWKREKDRCINGFYLADGQVFISGWLYFHTVYNKIAAYIEDDKGKKHREIITPELWDTHWDVAQDFLECENQGVFYNLVGSRDWGKSIIGASRAAHLYTFYSNSESVISGGADNYIKLVTDKIEDSLTNIHPIWKKNRIANDWKREVKAGWKDKKTNQIDPKSSNSRVLMRNYENGIKSMAANGTRPGFHLIDEEGTIQHFIACLKDSDGCWWSGGGTKPSCLVMCTGTGGDMEVGAQAGEVFNKPRAYNMLAFPNPETGGEMGRFISALRSRRKFKEEKPLSEYLGISHPDLDRVTIYVSNEERALKEWWKPAYERALKSGNQKTIIKFKAYWPLVASDCFLQISSNNYNVEAAKKQKLALLKFAEEMHDGFIGERVEIFHDGEKIRHKHSNKLPVTQYPHNDENTDAPVMMWEPPIQNPPWGLYVAGVDPYRQDSAEYSDSLGAVYIFKRMHEISSEKYQDMFVAAYVARPGSVDDWNEQARLLIKYYNAFTLCENDDMTFIRYMQNKGDDFYLADQPEWLKDVVPHSTVNRGKGIHRSSEKVRNFLRTCLKRWLDDVLDQQRDENGSVTSEVLGVSRVKDLMLLEEIIKFNKDGNFDREVAASLAVALADKMAPLGKVQSVGDDPRYQSYYNAHRQPTQNKTKSNSLFTNSSSGILRRERKSKLFL